MFTLRSEREDVNTPLLSHQLSHLKPLWISLRARRDQLCHSNCDKRAHIFLFQEDKKYKTMFLSAFRNSHTRRLNVTLFCSPVTSPSRSPLNVTSLATSPPCHPQCRHVRQPRGFSCPAQFGMTDASLIWREHAALTTDPLGLGVVNAELWFVQIRHSQLRLAAARELHWEKYS